MDRIKLALKFALTVCVIFHVIGFLFAIYLSDWETTLTDFRYIGPITISHFLFPCFLAVYFYEDTVFSSWRNVMNMLLKPALIAFLMLYVIVFITMSNKDFAVSFFNIASLFNAIIAFFITLFSSFIYFILTSKPNKSVHTAINLSLGIVLLLSLVSSVIYSLILSVMGSNFVSAKTFGPIIFQGVLVTFSTYTFFDVIKTKNLNRLKSNFLIFCLYVFNILILPLISFVVSAPDVMHVKLIKIVQSITVISPYYLFITLGIHVYYLYNRNKSEKEFLAQQGLSANLKYQQLKSQLSPHFLFNNLSVLTALIEENQEKAGQFSQNLSDVYRYFLNQEHQDLVTLEDELTFAKHYLNLLKIRFENALHISFNLENTRDINYYVLPLSLQQVFENIIKHNEISVAIPMKVSLSIEDDYLIISNKINLKKTQNSLPKTGIENMRKRYSYFTNQLIVVTSESVSYTIKLPLIKTE